MFRHPRDMSEEEKSAWLGEIVFSPERPNYVDEVALRMTGNYPPGYYALECDDDWPFGDEE